jgi:hypothetical protein
MGNTFPLPTAVCGMTGVRRPLRVPSRFMAARSANVACGSRKNLSCTLSAAATDAATPHLMHHRSLLPLEWPEADPWAAPCQKEVPEFLYTVFAAGHFWGELGERAIGSGTINAVLVVDEYGDAPATSDAWGIVE